MGFRISSPPLIFVTGTNQDGQNINLPGVFSPRRTLAISSGVTSIGGILPTRSGDSREHPSTRDGKTVLCDRFGNAHEERDSFYGRRGIRAETLYGDYPGHERPRRVLQTLRLSEYSSTHARGRLPDPNQGSGMDRQDLGG